MKKKLTKTSRKKNKRNGLATEAPLLIATPNPKSNLITCSNVTDCNLVQELDQNVKSGIAFCKSASKQEINVIDMDHLSQPNFIAVSELQLDDPGVPPNLRLDDPGVPPNLRLDDSGVPPNLRLDDPGVPPNLEPDDPVVLPLQSDDPLQMDLPGTQEIVPDNVGVDELDSFLPRGPYVCHTIGVETYSVALHCLMADIGKLKKVIHKLRRKVKRQKEVICRYQEFDKMLGF